MHICQTGFFRQSCTKLLFKLYSSNKPSSGNKWRIPPRLEVAFTSHTALFFLHKNLLQQTELVWLHITKNLLISLLRHFFSCSSGTRSENHLVMADNIEEKIFSQILDLFLKSRHNYWCICARNKIAIELELYMTSIIS